MDFTRYIYEPTFKSGLKYKFITENERKLKYSQKIIKQ